MPTRHRDFRRRRQPRSDFWGTVRFILWLGFFGVLSFAVGALVIARLALPGAPARPTEPQDEPTQVTPQPSAHAASSRTRSDDDTVVEPVLPGSSRSRSSQAPRTDTPSSVTPEPKRPREERQSSGADDEARPRRNASDDSRRPVRRATSEPADEPDRTPSSTRRERSSERRPETVSAPRRSPEPRTRSEGSGSTARESRPSESQRRETDRPRTSPPAERKERRDGGIQRSESID